MKKIILMISIMLLLLVSCSEKEVLPDFENMTVDEVLTWKVGKDVEVIFKSEYSQVIPSNTVISQDIEAGTTFTNGMVIEITYSRGLSPETTVELPNFEGYTQESVIEWLNKSGIYNHTIVNTYSKEVESGKVITVEVDKPEGRDDIMIKDQFNVKVSIGELIPEDVVFESGKFIGVNLGGWFVLEGWMTPDLFKGVNGSDETVFMQQKEDAEQVMIEHYNSFITEDDFKWLSEKGIRFVRLPIPWWLFGEDAYEGTELEVTYARSVEYIDEAMNFAQKYNINVLLDLHTAPGCQNGFDNGGITGVQEWGKNEEENGYVAKTIDVLKRITERYNQHQAFFGIELLNEPSWAVDMKVLQKFYIDAYKAVRDINKDIYIVMHDGFRSYMQTTWKEFFNNNEFNKVLFDIHLYSVFSDELQPFTLEEHMNYVSDNHGKVIADYKDTVPMIVGEWSFALPSKARENLSQESNKLATIAYGSREINVYNSSQGWFFWNYKIDRSSHLEWDFRRLYDQGYLPKFPE